MIMYFAKGFLLLQTLLLFLLPQFGTSQDTITISKPIRDNGSVLVSNGETFALGFFRPGKSTYRYVGIWYYNAPNNPVVWVANRDSPLNDTSGVLSIDDVLGNLVLHVKDRNTPIWSTTTNIVSKSRNNGTHAQLLDSGNLVLFHNETSKVLWQSFDYPTDTTLPNMKLGLDRTTGLNRILTSWKSKDDPGTGNYSYTLDTNGTSPELFLYKGNVRWWRSGHWNGQGWSGVPAEASPNLFYNLSIVNNQNETTTSWIVLQPSLFLRLVVNESGSIERFIARERDSQKWVSLGSVPSDRCDNYGKCGAYGICELQNGTEFECTCLPGFRPNSQNEWTARNASGGCVRKRGEASVCKRGEVFAKVENVKLPDSSVARLDSTMSLIDCGQQCLDNCNCTAYGSVKHEAGCMRWYGSLMDTRVLTGGQNLYVRVDALELGESSVCKRGEGFAKVENVKLPDSSVARLDSNMSLMECKQQCLDNCSCTAFRSVKEENVKLPDSSVAQLDSNKTLTKCKQQCLHNCSCTAYGNLGKCDLQCVGHCSCTAYGSLEGKAGCMSWYGSLMDTRDLTRGQILYIRVDALERGKGFFANKRRLAIMVVVLLVTSILLIFLFAHWLIKRKKNGRRKQPTLFNDVIASSTTFQDSWKLDESRRKPDLPIFDISTILAATDNFSPNKRLGQGGFGPVYKGQLDNGQEIAVKTLSRSSKQGTQEFMNEVMLITKLQHRNLGRLFGCCIHKEEKMLVYEYMPNKSLDFFIFDEIRRQLLDWKKRFEIISGIARGVLYLHQDSRLKIIHRDLKASNVLLDAAMNPKISDFGLARMFGDDQIEANTNRVVGTYGYMSPEYAMEGLYSIKSDVFAFGVLTLEIISGKRNNHYHVGSPYLNLIGHVWDLWMEGKGLEIVDSLLGEAYPAHEVSRCVHIGLLCVQEQATDRPTMAEIVFMLGNETALPPPNKPAFINRRIINSGQDSSSSARAPASINNVTISMLEAR